MITKYVGSVTGLLDCESIALVEVGDGIILQESNIPQYTINYTGFTKIKIIHRDSEGIFYAVNQVDPNTGRFNFILNHIVMYDSLGNPVGYANLTQQIDFDKYGVESITVNFDYTIINKVVYLNLDVDYLEHNIATNNKQAHLNLFSGTKGGYKAVSKSDLNSLLKTRQGFTRNVIDSNRNPKLLYRYSGFISSGKNYFWNGYWRVLRDDLDQSIYQEIFEFNGDEILLLYCATVKGPLLIIYKHKLGDPSNTSTRLEPLPISIESPLHMGSNMIIQSKMDGSGTYFIHSTEDIIQDAPISERLKGLYDNNMGFQLSDIPDSLVDGYYFNSDFMPKIVEVKLRDLDGNPLSNLLKDPFSKVLRFYSKNGDIIQSNDPEVREILNEFNNPKFKDQSIIYASRGLIFTAKLDSNFRIATSSDGLPIYGLYTYDLPGVDSIPYRNPFYSSIGDPFTHERCKSKLDKRLNLCMISDISFITPSLFYINRSEYDKTQFRNDSKINWNNIHVGAKDIPEVNDPDPHAYYLNYNYYNQMVNSEKYLVEVGTNFDYTDEIYDYHTKLEFYNLKGESGMWNYDKLLKSYDREARDKTLMNLTFNGNLYGYKLDSSGNYLIGRL